MEEVLNWGLSVIRAIQTIENPVLTVIMKVITTLGTKYFFIMFLPILIWNFNERKTIRMGLFFIFSTEINSWLKVFLHVPRPFTLDPSVGRAYESSFSMPSGHSQSTSTFWGLIAPLFKKPLGLILAIVVPLIVAFTRMYLGVHYPTDVGSGLLLGWGFALLAYFFGEKLSVIVEKWNIRIQIIAAAVITFGMNVLLPSDSSMPGAFFGVAVGAAFMVNKLHYNSDSGTIKQKIIRSIIGLVTVVAVYLITKLICPKDGSELYNLFRFIRYFLTCVWGIFGAPWLFIKMKLAEAHPTENHTVEAK